MCVCAFVLFPLGAAYLLIKISISLFALSVCLFQQPVKMVAGWLLGWLAGCFVSLWGFCLLMMSDGVTVSWLSLFFLWSEREREIVKASRQHIRLTATD